MAGVIPAQAVVRPNGYFWLSHLGLPLLAMITLLVVLEPGGLDLWLADRWYALGGNEWSFADHWLTYDLIHHYGKLLVILTWLVVAAVLAMSYRQPRLQPLRGTLALVLTGMALLPAIIARAKHYTQVPCPWDLARYGGEAPYRFNLAYDFPAGELAGYCFPAGHASGGYALLVMYFAAIPWLPRPALMLLPGLLVGFIFGTGQQARGAHFLSHDVWTASLCWFGALALFMVFRARGWIPAGLPRRWSAPVVVPAGVAQ